MKRLIIKKVMGNADDILNVQVGERKYAPIINSRWLAYKKKNMKKKYVVCFVIICIFIIALVNSIYQEVKWGKNEPTVFYDVQAVHASESWDFFIIDDEDNFYVEDHEKNIVQRFNSKGEFQVGYSFGKFNIISGLAPRN